MDLRGFLGKEETKYTSASRLDYYRDILARDGYIENYRFSRCDEHVGLTGYDGDVELFLPLKEVIHERPDKESYVTSRNLDRVYNLKIIGIDEAVKKVTVSYFKAQEKLRTEMEKKISEAIEKGEHPVVKATVYAVPMDSIAGKRLTCFCDIYGLGIFAKMNVRDWSNFYTPGFDNIVTQGDVIEVAVTKKSARSGMAVYDCSRKECLKSEVSDFQKRFPAGSSVTVKCVSREKDFFVGQIVGYETAYCVCRYPKGQKVNIGCRFVGFIKEAQPGRPVRVGIGAELK